MAEVVLIGSCAVLVFLFSGQVILLRRIKQKIK